MTASKWPFIMVGMRLPASLSFLVDKAIECQDGAAFLTELAARLVADGIPLAGGALTQLAPHPIIQRRTWLWRADGGTVLESLGLADPGEREHADVARD